MDSRSSRLARGWLVGSAATLVAAISHDLAGGDFPGWLALLIGTVFAGTAGTLLIGRHRSLPRLAGVIATGQAAFHLGFSQLGAPSPVAAAHVHGTDAVGWADPVAGHAAHLLTPGMIAAHVAAGLITVALLRAAESALLRMLAERARLLVRRLVAVVGPSPAVRAPAPATEVVVVTPASRLVVATLPRRGPPVPSFA